MGSVSPDSGKVYNLNGCSIHDADNGLQSGDITVIGDGLPALPPGRAIMSAAILVNCDMSAAAAGVGRVSIRHRTPAKTASSHTAISANLPLCANNSADVLAFWRSFAPPSLPCLCDAPAASRL